MKQRMQGIFIGFLVMVLLLSGVTVWAATGTQNITITYRDIKIFVNGVQTTPRDVNGNIVEPFIYNGTTYLPVRAVSEALGQTVDWDGNTNSVYIGGYPNQSPAPTPTPQPPEPQPPVQPTTVTLGEDIKAYQLTRMYEYPANGFFRMAGEIYYDGVALDSLNSSYGGSAYYSIGGEYRNISGVYGPVDGFGNFSKSRDITIYGDGKVLAEYTSSSGDMPTSFSVDVTGVMQLMIEISKESSSPWPGNGSIHALANLVLTK